MNPAARLSVIPLVLVALVCAFLAAASPTVTASEPPSDMQCPPADINSLDLNAQVPVGTPGCPIHLDTPREPQSAALDERVEITDTTQWPWRAIAHLRVVTDLDGVYTCSGYFVAPDIVMTAAHCLYDSAFSADGYATTVEVTPGRDGTNKPYGSQITTDFSVANGYINVGSNHYDWGLVYMPDATLGNQVGWFTYEVAAQSLVDTTVNLSGYPADKGGSTQWHEFGLVTELNEIIYGSLSYDIYTASGQSGAPVWTYDGTTSSVVATHTLGKGSTACYQNYNCGVPITTTIAQSMQNAGVGAPNTTCYTLAVSQSQSAAGSGTATAQPPSSAGCQDSGYGPGTTVTLTALTISGYNFTGWSGGCSGTSSTIQFTMTANRSCTANYQSNTPNMLIWGDINCSGASDPIDGLLVLRFDAGLNVNTPADCPKPGQVVQINGGGSFPWADVDCGPATDPIDALKILRNDAGLVVNQPAGCPDIGAQITIS